MGVPGSNGAEVEQTGAETQQWLADKPSARRKRAVMPPGPELVADGDGALKQRVSDLERELSAMVRERDEALNAAQAAEETSKELERARKELDKAREAKDSIERRLGKEHAKREADLEKRFNGRQAALEKQLDEVEERLDGREAVFREQAKDRERKLNSRIEELESVLAEAQQRAIAKLARRSSRRKRKLDLNEATFEQLRDMGLSVTLSARVIAYRDTRGAFQSLDELNEIPGLSVELKRVLSEKLAVG